MIINEKPTFRLATFVVMTAGSGAASALTIGFDDLAINPGTYEIVVEDGSGLDSNPVPGVVTYIGPAGGGVWTVNVGTGSDLSPLLDLNSIDISSSAGDLVVSAWHQFPGIASFDLKASIGGTTEGSVPTATFSQYALGATSGGSAPPTLPPGGSLVLGPFPDTGNTAFEGEGSLADALAGASGFDLGIDVHIRHPGPGYHTTSFDALLAPDPDMGGVTVPLPPAALLFGSAILGAIGAVRRSAEHSG